MDESPRGYASLPETRDSTPEPKKKKKDKVRRQWFSFIGRIVAQIIGAVASITLAIVFLQRAQTNEAAPGAPAAAPVSRPAPREAASRRDGRITLAVLPLVNYSGDPREDYFADGMTDALIADLAQIDGLRVISRTSVMQYRAHQKAIPQVASELDADMIVEGSVVRAGDRVRVTAQLIETATDSHLWARSYEHTLRDVLALQGRVVAEIAKEVKGVLTPYQEARLAQRRPVDPVVYDLYLRGRNAWSLRTPAGFEAAASFFQQAIEKDPTFALAYAGLADVYVFPNTRANPRAPADARAKAVQAVTRALELDDSLAEAHASRAGLYLFQDRNRPAAEKEFRRALELNPGYPTAHMWYAILLAEEGRDTEALEHAREATSLDPWAGTTHQVLGLVQYYGRRYAEAANELRRAIELSPQLPLAPVILAKALFMQGVYTEAIKAAEATPEPRGSDQLAILGLSYLRAGKTERASAILKDLRSRTPLPAVSLAQWHAVTGDTDAAIAMLSKSAPGLVATPAGVDPLFDRIRSDPRFPALVGRGQL